jgi:hypothetical protein
MCGSPDGEGGEEGWIKSLVRKIKHNVIVHVKDLNITYIDSDASVIASVSCAEINSYPADGNWLKAFLVCLLHQHGGSASCGSHERLLRVN